MIAAAPQAPYPSHRPPRQDATPVIVAVILVAVVAVILIAVIASLPVGRIGDGTSSRPVITTTVTKTASGVDVLVAGIQPTADPRNIKVNIENVSSATFGGAVPMPTSSGGIAIVTVGTGPTGTVFYVTWQNPGGSGMVSPGDHFVIDRISGAYSPGTTFAFLLLWSDGSILATNSYWQV